MTDVKKIKPALSKGTRDFLPSEVAKRNYIFDTIKSVFRKYGFEQIETPAIERLETLMGKYGEEGDKLLFKILNSGDFLKDIPISKLQNPDYREWITTIAEKGLRYDLTVPLARYVVMNQDKLPFPFKRFHIGPVWRADRPQKGRYQEFCQCDADVIGSNSLLNEVELTMIYAEVFKKLNLTTQIHINNRKFLHGLAQLCSAGELFEEFCIILDKWDKIGSEGVDNELKKHPLLGPQQVGIKFNKLIMSFFNSKEYFSSSDKLHYGKTYFQKLFTDNKSEEGLKGLKEIETVFTEVKKIIPNASLVFSIALARGLTYYSGTIWEVVLDTLSYPGYSSPGSLGGGGRYDNLTEMFGGQNMSGVGISFGIERIYDVMEELNLFPATISQGVKVLFVPREEAVEQFAFQQTQALRDAGISAEIFLGNVKKQKHYKYVEDKNIAYIIEIGENEMKLGKFRLRNAQTRETKNDLTLQQVIQEVI